MTLKLSEPNDYDRALRDALVRLDSDRPKQAVVDVVSNDSWYLPKPGGWDNDFSSLQQLEYPVDQNPPEFLAKDAYQCVTRTDGRYILTSDIPANVTVRVFFTVRYQVSNPDNDEVVDTVPEQYKGAVVDYAAYLLLHELANYYAADGDSSINADSVDRQSKSDRYARRARTSEERYFNTVGVAKKHNKHACAVGSMGRKRT